MTTDDRPPLLQGGRRRRRSPLRLLPLALLLGLLLWVGFAALDLVPRGSDDRSREGRAAQPARDPDPPRLLDEARTPPAVASRQRASRFHVDLSGQDAVRLRFVRKPRAGLLFDVRTGRVLWRRNAGSPAGDRKPDEDDDGAPDRGARGCARARSHHATRHAHPRFGDRGPAPRQAGAAGGASERPAARVRQRRCDRARPAQRRHGARLRAADERARRGDGPRVHAVLDSPRARGQGQPFVRRRSRRPGPGRPAPAPHQAHRAAASGRS